MQHKCNTSVILMTRGRQECYTNDSSETRVKKFDLITTRVKTYFHTLISATWQAKDYKDRKNLILRTTFSKCLFSMPKCVLKSAPQKLNFLMEIATSKRCTLDCSYKCSCTFPHSYAQQRLIFDKNYFM